MSNTRLRPARSTEPLLAGSSQFELLWVPEVMRYTPRMSGKIWVSCTVTGVVPPGCAWAVAVVLRNPGAWMLRHGAYQDRLGAGRASEREERDEDEESGAHGQTNAHVGGRHAGC